MQLFTNTFTISTSTDNVDAVLPACCNFPNWSNNQSMQIYTMKAVKYQFSLPGVALIKSHAQVKK